MGRSCPSRRGQPHPTQITLHDSPLGFPVANQEEEAFSSPGLGGCVLGRGYWGRGGTALFEVPFLRCASSAVPLRKDFLVSDTQRAAGSGHLPSVLAAPLLFFSSSCSGRRRLPTPGERATAPPDQSTRPWASHKAYLLLRFGIGASEQEEVIQEISKDPCPDLPSLPKVKEEEEELNLFRRAGPNRGCQLGNRSFAGCWPGLPLERSGDAVVLTKRILGAGGVPRPEIRAGSKGCCLVPHHVAPKVTWSCENRVPPCFPGELGASAAKPAPERPSRCKTLQGRAWPPRGEGLLSQF